ncbi:OmpW family protein [Pandoraea aquatica]|uniref:OmpW family protein n=1 Tax=Pandoraea aquatica TaxID=2508290 RepID=A0A5E4Z2X1_9BURK|nr:OmpW family outer membrane protein [Pandoraea aquatica]VVE55466.1 OmpW family protein [Pandoraea aquatica]
MKLKHLTIAAAAMLTASGAAFAQQAGDTMVSAGWFHLSPQVSSDPLHVTGSSVPGLANAVNARLGNTGANVDDADTLGLTLTHFFTDNIAVEGVFGVPPKFRLYGTGNLALPGGGSLASAKQWSPAILLKYYFGKAGDTWRPFLGIGASYFWYSNIELTPGFQQLASASLTAGAGGNTTAQLTNSWAPVFNAGLNWNVDKHWTLAFSVSYIPVSTTAKLTTTRGPITTTSEAKVKLNPVVTFLSLGYRF